MKLTESNLVRRWVSSVLFGEDPGYSFHGTPQQLNALSEALMSVHLLEQEMKKEETSVESVMECLDRKHLAVQRFEAVFGKSSWPI